MRPERAGQTLPCRQCGAKMIVPGRASGFSISPGLAILGGAGIGLLLLVIGIVSTYSSRSRAQQSASSDSVMSPGPSTPLITDSSHRSNQGAPSPNNPPLASNHRPGPDAGQNSSDAMDPEAREIYEEHRRRMAEQGIFLPENPETFANDPGSAKLPDQNVASNGSPPGSMRPPSQEDSPDYVPENSKIRTRIGEWKPCVDAIPQNFLPAWEPAKTNKQSTEESGRIDVAFAGSSSPFIAMETQTFGEEWTVFDMRSKRPAGLAFVGRGFSSQRVLRRDGKYFATSFEEGVRVTDIREKQILGTFRGNPGHNGTIAFLGTDRLAICSERQLLIWTVPEAELIQKVSLPESHERTIAFSAGGRYAAMPGVEHGSRVIRIIDLSTGNDAGLLYGARGDSWSGTRAIAFSDDGLELAAVVGGHMMVWDLQTGEVAEDFDLGSNAPERRGFDAGVLEWFPNKQKWLVNSSVVVDRASQSILFRLEENGVWTSPAAVASDNHLIAMTADGRFRGFAVADLTGPPFTGSQPGSESGTASVAALSLPLVKEADWSTVQTLEPALETPPWEIVPDPATTPAEPLQSTIGIPLREDRMTDLRFSGATGASVALAYDVDSFGSRSKRDLSKCRIEVFSLTSGRRTNQLKLLDQANMMALSPSGNRVLTQSDSNTDRVDVWDLEKKVHVAGWKPAGSNFHSNAAAMFVDETHVLTLSEQKLVMWELPSCRAIYQIEKAEGPGVSPTGKYLAVRSGNVYVMLEALTGKMVGRLTTDDQITAASFHPNGQLFAAVTQVGGYFDTKFADLVVWDMKNGARIAHVPLQYAGTSMHWCGDSHVLIDNTILVDIVRQVPIWTYSIRNGLHCMLSPDDRHWYLTRPERAGRSELKLRSVQLPELDVTTKTAGKVGAELIAMKPGTEVAYSFDAGTGPVTQATKTAILEKVRLELIRNGMIPVERSQFRVLVSMEERLTNEQLAFTESSGIPGLGGFGGFGRIPRMRPGFGGRFGQPPQQPPGPTQTIQKREVECSVRLTDNGTTLWQSSRIYDNPYTVEIKEGQSVPDAVREKLWEHGLAYFTELRLPKYVYQANEGFGYGETALTYDGPLTLGGDPIRPDEHLGYRSIPDLDLWRSILGQ